MNQLLKKTWLFFYILAFSGLLILAMSIYLKYDELEYKLQTEQHYSTKFFDTYLSSAFFQFESMLELISYESTIKHDLKISIIDNILARSPLLIGFGLFNTDGTAQSLSSSLQAVRFPNLLTDENTKQWFQLTLAQDQMTIGRPYYLNALKKWVIPVRKRIVNPQGEVIGVIASGLDLQALSVQWNDGTNGQRVMEATLDQGFYRMLRSNLALNKYQQMYTTPVAAKDLQEIREQLALKSITLDDLRKSNTPIQVKLKREDTLYLTFMFNSKLNIWVSARESDALLKQQLLQLILLYSALFLAVLVIIFFLFKWIASIEQNKITELTYRAEHDLLTGLYNRSILNSKNIKHYTNNLSFSLLYIDLDHFKSINDGYGYSYGDSILVEVSKRIKKALNSIEGTAIRLSADEFVLLINCVDKVEISQYCQALLADISLPYMVNNNDFKISASIGIAQSPSNATGIETLISYANNSMLIAKKSKNNFVFFSEKIHLQLIKNIEIEHALQSAISKDEISLVYQPQLDNQQQLYGVEALVRWKNDELGVIPPDQFIPIAEETGLMPELGAYIMHKAMVDISTLQYRKHKAFKLSINVSARQFVQLNFFETLISCLSNYKSPYMSITIEITESLFIENIERLLPIFKKMKNENISLSLDDFGTGYSSLSMLRKVPIDELKIDKSFVDHIVSNNNDRAMVKSIINMGKNLGMTVLAEGVEDSQQATILSQSGCDIYQGYYFSKPLNLADLEEFIDQH